MFPSPIGPIDGSELIRGVLDGQRIWLTRPQVLALIATPEQSSFPTGARLSPIGGGETINARQGGQRVAMTRADFETFLAGTATPDVPPPGQGVAALTGRERLFGVQGATVTFDVSEIADLRNGFSSGGSATPGLARTVSGTIRHTPPGSNNASADNGGNDYTRVWDKSNVDCFDPEFWFPYYRCVPITPGQIDQPGPIEGLRFTHMVVTDLVDRTLKDQSGGKTWRTKFTALGADPKWLAAGGSVSADGYTVTCPPAMQLTSLTWANGVATATVPTTAWLTTGDIIAVEGKRVAGNPTARETNAVLFTSQAAVTVISPTQFTYFISNATTTAPVDMPFVRKGWLIKSDKTVGLNLKNDRTGNASGYFHYVGQNVPNIDGRVNWQVMRNIPAARADLGDCKGGPPTDANWGNVTTQVASGCVPMVFGTNYSGAKLWFVDGDSVTSQNNGIAGFTKAIDTGDADGVLNGIKQALNAEGQSWVDCSVPGTNQDQYFVAPGNQTTYRYGEILPMADYVYTGLGLNDRRTSSSSYENGFGRRMARHNAILRSRMKAGAKLVRATIPPKTAPQRWTRVDVSGTTGTFKCADTTRLVNGYGYDLYIPSAANASTFLYSNNPITIVDATTFTTTVQSGSAATSTVGGTIGDRFRTRANQWWEANDQTYVPDYATNTFVGHLFRANDEILRINTYAGVPYGGAAANDIDFGVDYYGAVGTSMTGPNPGLWKVDGTDNYMTNDGVHPVELGHINARDFLRPQVRAFLAKFA